MINIDDFHYMWKGKATRPLTSDEVYQLKPIDIRQKGDARALLLLHGFASSPAVYRALYPKLTHYNALVCPVLPGHAENLNAFAGVSRQAWLAAAVKACQPLVEQYQSVEIIGLSLGGLLACHLAKRFPIQHLYLLAPAFKLSFNLKLAKTTARVLHALQIKHIKNRAGNLLTHTHDELTYKQLPLHTMIELFTFIEESQNIIPHCKTDLFLGKHDDVIDSNHVMYQFKNHPHCQTHWLPQSAHAIPLDGDLDSILNVINPHND